MAEVGAVQQPQPVPGRAAAPPVPPAEGQGRPAAPADAGSRSAQPASAARPGLPVTVVETEAALDRLPAPASLAARVLATTNGQIRLETALGQVLVTAGEGPLPQAGATLRLAIDAGGTMRLLPASAQGSAASVPVFVPAAAAGAPLAPGDVVPARLLPVPSAQGRTRPAPVALTVRVVSVQEPAAAQPPQPLPLAPSGVSEATVSARAVLGQPILDFANGRLVIDRGALADGARVQLEVLHAAKAALPASPAIAPLAEALDEVLAALAAQPALAATMAARMPQMGPRLGSGALFLLSALQGGAVGALVSGEAQQALRVLGREAALKRLAEVLARHSPRLEVEPAATGSEFWRTLYLPVATPQGWQPLRVAWREPAPHGDEGEADDQARFRIDFSFSRLGPVRLDGLAATGRLDLLLVSRTALGPEARQEIEALFDAAVGAIGRQGHIRFVEQPDLVAPEVRADERHASVTA